MSYGEKIESVIIKLKVHKDIKESGFDFRYRKGMLQHLVEFYESKNDSQDLEQEKIEINELDQDINHLNELEESLKPFITAFYN